MKKSVAPFSCGHGVDAPDILCAQLVHDLFVIAKFLVQCGDGLLAGLCLSYTSLTVQTYLL